jgi:hypothetical protein
MANGVNSGSSWAEILKAIMASQVGGWVIACIVFAFVIRWVIHDRAEVYKDVANLRDKAMPAIVVTEETVLRNEKLLQEIARKVGANPYPEN